jgi:hypothetical protein
MRKLFLLTMLAFAVAPVASADTLEIAIGGTVAGDVVATSSTGAVALATTSDGWLITIGAISNSPGASPFLLDLNVSAECTDATCAGTTLDVFASDIGYTGPASGFTMTDAGSAKGGSTTAIGWADSNNVNLQLMGIDLIAGIHPSLGPFSTGTFSGSLSGGPAESAPPYSVIIEETFTDGGAGNSGFSADASLSATPEPAALALFSSGLVLLPAAFRRRKASR